MKYIKIIFIIYCLTTSIVVFGQEVPLSKVREIGINFFEQVLKERNINIGEPVILEVLPMEYKGNTTFYVINFKNGGYVIVSADFSATPILGYNPTENYIEKNIPGNYQSILNDFKSQIYKAKLMALRPDSLTNERWKSIELKTLFSLKSGNQSVAAIGPLIEAHWRQGSDFNALCPTYYETHAKVGCVAVAMGQILYDQKFPIVGRGTTTYDDSKIVVSTRFLPDYGVQYADFGNAYYDYVTMNISTATSESQELLYHCGVAAIMDYGSEESGAFVKNAKAALKNHFRYLYPIYLEKVNFTYDEWKNLILTHLNNNLTVLYAGNNGDKGHAFIVDGYDGNNFFHMNFGWGIGKDDWVALDAILSYNLEQEAIFNICKPTSLAFYNMSTDLSGKIVSNTLVSTSILSGVIKNNSILSLQTESSIILKKGFKVEKGSIFYGSCRFVPFSYYSNTNITQIYTGNSSDPESDTERTLEDVYENINNWSVFPNPSANYFTINSVNADQEYTYSVTSINGGLIVKSEISTGATQVDLSSQPGGVYFIIIQTKDGELIRKKIVKL